jgi:UMP-CMP kinase
MRNTPCAGEQKAIVYVLGGPGAGKGTQCEMLAAKYRIGHLSVGDILRAERDAAKSPYAEIIRKNMEQGTVGPMKITVELLEKAMEKLTDKGIAIFLLDGT